MTTDAKKEVGPKRIAKTMVKTNGRSYRLDLSLYFYPLAEKYPSACRINAGVSGEEFTQTNDDTLTIVKLAEIVRAARAMMKKAEAKKKTA